MTAHVRSDSKRPLPKAALLKLALMALQLFVAVRFFTTPPAFIEPALTWTTVLESRQLLFGSALIGVIFALVQMGSRRSEYWQDWLALGDLARGPWPWLLQIATCCTCYALVWPLYVHPLAVGSWGWPLLTAWGLAVPACALASLWLLAPLSFWRRLLMRERRVAALSAAATLAGGALIALMFQAWTAVPLLVRITLSSSVWLLRQYYPEAQVDVASAVVTVEGFAVQISDACSGYLGMSLTLTFLACYCYLFRHELKPWVVALLLPLGVAISLALNAVRIALLVMLGVEVSPELAVAGFHTHAGSIAMVVTWLLVVGLVHRFAIAPSTAAGERLGWTLDYESALLVPLMVLITATLLTGALSGHFVWLYPLRVVLTALALAWCWNVLRLDIRWTDPLPVLAGLAGYGIWIVMIPADADASARFGDVLASVSPLAAAGWLLFRVLGAVVTVPIAEELAFRGYVLTVLSRRPPRVNATPSFDWIGFIGSSLLFGALHGQWLAGTVAGMIYAGVRYRRGRLWDAVIAHGTTNLMLAIHVALTGHWSYW